MFEGEGTSAKHSKGFLRMPSRLEPRFLASFDTFPYRSVLPVKKFFQDPHNLDPLDETVRRIRADARHHS